MLVSVYQLVITCGMLQSFITNSAAGLYYLAEMIEEYSVLAKKILTYLLIVSEHNTLTLLLVHQSESDCYSMRNRSISLNENEEGSYDGSHNAPS